MSTLIVKNLDAPTGESIVAPDLQLNVASSDLPTGSILQVVRDSTAPVNPTTSYTDLVSLNITTKKANSRFLLMFSSRAYTWYLGNGGRQRVTYRFFDSTASTDLKVLDEMFQVRDFQLGGNMEYGIPFAHTMVYENAGYAAGATFQLKVQAKKIESNNFQSAFNDFQILEIAG